MNAGLKGAIIGGTIGFVFGSILGQGLFEVTSVGITGPLYDYWSLIGFIGALFGMTFGGVQMAHRNAVRNLESAGIDKAAANHMVGEGLEYLTKDMKYLSGYMTSEGAIYNKLDDINRKLDEKK